MVLSWQATDESKEVLLKQNVPESILAKIPKDWDFKTFDRRGKDCAIKSMYKVFVTFHEHNYRINNLRLFYKPGISFFLQVP